MVSLKMMNFINTYGEPSLETYPCSFSSKAARDDLYFLFATHKT
jgi:hypothetical protein